MKMKKKREMKKRELPLTSRKVVFAHDNESLNHECFDPILHFFVLPLFRLLFNLTTKQMSKTNKQTNKQT